MTSPFHGTVAENEGQQVPDAASTAARAAADKLGFGTVILAMGDRLAVTDAFVITSGHNPRQVRALVDEIERQVEQATGRAPYSIEGLRDLQWVLMDYGDFVVHVFHEETRTLYDLERLWGDAPRVDWQDHEANGHRD